MLEDDEFRAFLKALGSRIKTFRKEKKLDMRHIMIVSGYYDAQWRKYEAGGSLNIASLMKVALALDVSLTELFDGLGQWPKLSVAEIKEQHGIQLDSEPEPKAEHIPEQELELEQEPEEEDPEPTPPPKPKKAASAKKSNAKPADPPEQKKKAVPRPSTITKNITK